MKLKKFISIFCSVVVAMSCFMTFVGAEGDTTKAEIYFGLWRLDGLPTGRKLQDNLSYYLKKISSSELKSDRECQIKYKDGKIDTVKIDEKAVYDEIRAKVRELEKKVDDRTPNNPLTEEDKKDIEQGKKSKHYNLPKKMRVAKAIYRWVAKNIKYDYESIEKDENGEESYRKPQDAIFVYSQRMGVCEGKSNLVNLMMRMANIPSMVISTIIGKNEQAHAYNAIYLIDTINNREGWTLIDSTWAMDDSDSSVSENKNTTSDSNKCRLQKYFPAFYNNITFLKANTWMIMLPTHRISYLSSGKINHDFDEYIYYSDCDVIAYELSGKEGDAYIHAAFGDDLIERAHILPKLATFNIKIKVGKGIKSLVLRGNETIDLSDATDLTRIYASTSNKYIVEDGVLYEKNIYGAKGNKVDVPANVKIVGEKSKVINKENQDKLEKIKGGANDYFEEYKSYLKGIKYPDNLFQQKMKEYGDKYDEVISIYNAMKDNPSDKNVNIFSNKVYYFTNSIATDMSNIMKEYGCIIF